MTSEVTKSAIRSLVDGTVESCLNMVRGSIALTRERGPGDPRRPTIMTKEYVRGWHAGVNSLESILLAVFSEFKGLRSDRG